ncbi:FUSC family protein [Listeria goaensis]|uniref:FUSC family protein n=1 Tax=Listeria goaensis TaxID=1649188 RepID=UPI000B593E9C|nr:FUSC family protein [Listeria goaensis]
MTIQKYFKEYFSWNWSNAVLTFISAIPVFLIATLVDMSIGMGMLIGLIPAAITKIAPTRRGRVSILIMGAVIALSVLIGALLKSYFGIVGATVSMGAFAYLSAMFAASKKGVPAFMFFITPVIGIGLSITDFQAGVSIGLSMVLGSTVACMISLFFKETKGVKKAPAVNPNKVIFKQYAPYFTTAIMLATVIGFYLDHTGWIVGSVGLVMRPVREMQEMRSVFRIVSVVTGIVLIYIVMLSNAGNIIIAGAAAMMLVLASGTHESKAYIMPLFMTYIVFSFMMVINNEMNATHWWLLAERILWVSAGVVIAYVFGLLIPKFVNKKKAVE